MDFKILKERNLDKIKLDISKDLILSIPMKYKHIF